MSLNMRLSGNSAPRKAQSRLLLPLTALAAALVLSGCVNTSLTTPAPEPVVAVEAPPEFDPTIYAARNDGKFNLPAIPVDKIPAAHRRQVVDYPTDLVAGTIVIDPTPKFLYYVLGGGKAIRYGISVGAEGFQWSGESIVANKRQWPTWTPPAYMIARKPSLEKWKNGQPGGPTNPMGARAIYLTSDGVDHGYRIHGTPEWRSIGRNASSGCFRMINQDVLDLYDRVKGGERVIVLTASGEMPNNLTIPPPQRPKTPVKPAAKPEAETTTTTPAVTAPITPAVGLPPALGGTTTPAAPATTPALPGITEGVLPEKPAQPAAPTTGPATAPSPLSAPPTVNTFAPSPNVSVFTPTAPVTTPAAPSCGVPLVNGACPEN